MAWKNKLFLLEYHCSTYKLFTNTLAKSQLIGKIDAGKRLKAKGEGSAEDEMLR